MIYNENNNLYLSLIGICLISFLGAIVYRVYSLNTFGVLLTLSLSTILFILIKRKFKLKFYFFNLKELVLEDWLFLFVYICLFLSGIYLLLTSSTANSIVTPWEVVGKQFFLIYTLLSTILVISIFRKSRIFNFLIILHYWLSFSVALIVYRIGYGFDPFIHQASVNYINEHGAIEPKTLYYLGQYSLVTLIHKITVIPIAVIDKLLIPTMAAIFLPLVSGFTLLKIFKHTIARKLVILFSLVLPFSLFIVTTPQSLAYLFLIILILLSIKAKKRIDWLLLYLLALACLVTQPIAGIPAILFVTFLVVYKEKIVNYKNIIYSVIFLLNVTILPISFIMIESSHADISLSSLFNFDTVSLSPIVYPQEGNVFLNFVYLYQSNIQYVIFVLIVIGLYLAYTNKKYKKYHNFIYLNQALALFVAYLLTNNLSFNFLINYERNNYADRVLFVAVLFSLPFILFSLYRLMLRVVKQNKIIKISFLVILISLVTASLYVSYPRFDTFNESRGYATSNVDVAAVNWIKEDAGDNDYIVLANQQVSAASLSEFGFAKYYTKKKNKEKNIGNNKIEYIFYYPIPTGGELYNYYLKIVDEQVKKETIYEAMDLVGVDIGYFVINDYWWTFNKAIAEGKIESNSYKIIGEENVYIFKFTK